MSNDTHRRHDGQFHWQDVDVLAYKQSGEAPFKDVTRQVLFEDPDLGCQWRYFEVAPGGHTTLERHQHVHAVMVVRGRGRALVGERIHELANHDLVKVPPLTWHQFRAPDDEPLGFLCLVNAERDRPQLPREEDLAALRADEQTAEFIRT
ncbi:MAG: cupin domain-containing protein [Proteobacteria bacterium]|nr:cupin domain-containing protein [Pseudomonadota bacterium]